jgi:hypothetical protein
MLLANRVEEKLCQTAVKGETRVQMPLVAMAIGGAGGGPSRGPSLHT